jgi:hypothetical protein
MVHAKPDSLQAGTGQKFHPDPAHKLSADLYDIYHCCVYSEKLLMMDRGTVLKHIEFYSKNKFEKFVHLFFHCYIFNPIKLIQN